MSENDFGLGRPAPDVDEDEDMEIGQDFTLSGAEIDTLAALVKRGPLEDGDVPSKSGRDVLLSIGFAAKVIVKGEDGYQAATYVGAAWYREHYGPRIK